jgi:hypothetical protein
MRGVTLAQLAEQLAALGEIHGSLPLSIAQETGH